MIVELYSFGVRHREDKLYMLIKKLKKQPLIDLFYLLINILYKIHV